ncbi:AGAP013144-PA-like protein [Anopheles sinensis]|uniref:AGAP013144-PA-like protein n=1 Tax=Anopheles sinensis TaxID=74873 RepID=A0A084VTZ0_ANOSI|nr:AGAP013144-PA-like protein [Anopheles sinensis]
MSCIWDTDRAQTACKSRSLFHEPGRVEPVEALEIGTRDPIAKKKDPYPVDALPTCNHALSVCQQERKCIKLFEDFKQHCKVRENKCRMEDRDLCYEAWTNLRLSPMFGCICPNNHMKRRCDKIFSVVNHNPCVAYSVLRSSRAARNVPSFHREVRDVGVMVDSDVGEVVLANQKHHSTPRRTVVSHVESNFRNGKSKPNTSNGRGRYPVPIGSMVLSCSRVLNTSTFKITTITTTSTRFGLPSVGNFGANFVTSSSSG